jgi:hypothetical protein
MGLAAVLGTAFPEDCLAVSAMIAQFRAGLGSVSV